MKRTSFIIGFILVAITVGGCIPRRLFWSPDGQRLAVLTEDGLRLSDPSGKLSEPIANFVELVAWLPDSHRFVAELMMPAKTWEEASVVLPEERRRELLQLADRVRQEILAYSGDWEKFEPSAKAGMSDEEFLALLLYVRDHRREGLPEKLGEKWKDFEKMTAEVHLLQIYDVSDLRATPGQILTKTLGKIGEMRLSPDGQTLACVQGERLSVLPVSGGALRTVAEPVATYPDWTSDNRSLVYATTRVKPSDAGDSLQLGTIALRQVRDESGALLKEFAAPDERIGVVFWPQMTIRCLRDGRILFSAMEVNLPATKQDMPQRATLFSFDPDKQPTVSRVIPRGSEASLPDGLSAGIFEVSPDEKRIAVQGTKATVSVIILATGEVQEVLKEPDAEVKSAPAWRNSEELTIVVPPKSKWGSPNRDEIVLWCCHDKAKCLSCDWPVLFEKKEDAASKPAGTGSIIEGIGK